MGWWIGWPTPASCMTAATFLHFSAIDFMDGFLTRGLSVSGNWVIHTYQSPREAAREFGMTLKCFLAGSTGPRKFCEPSKSWAMVPSPGRSVSPVAGFPQPTYEDLKVQTHCRQANYVNGTHRESALHRQRVTRGWRRPSGW